MKNILVILFLINIPYSFCQSWGYDILKNHNLDLSKIREFKQNEIDNYYFFINNLLATDQEKRNFTLKNQNGNLIKIDSINFKKYSFFIEKNGYYTTNYRIWDCLYKDNYKLIDGIYDYDLQKKQFVFIKNKKIDTIKVKDFFLMNYTLQLHFSDRFGFELMNLIEKSITYKKTCNEEDLMNYFVTYLSRNTQFETFKFFGITYHVVLLPNLKDKNSFSKYYKYALNKFLKFKKNYDLNFKYVLFNNLKIDNKKKFDWCGLETNNIINRFEIFNKIKNGNDKMIYLESIIKETIKYINNDNTYSLLFCNHCKLKGMFSSCNPSIGG